MKRLWIALLVFCLVAPACLGEEIEERKYPGTWVHRDESDQADLIMEILHLDQDHKAYYIYQAFHGGKATYGFRRIGTWVLAGNGIDIDLGETDQEKYHATQWEYMILELKQTDQKDPVNFIAVTNDMLAKMGDDVLAAAEENNLLAEQIGVTVPMGHWRVGVDIPAGAYSIQLAPGVKSAYIRIWRQAYNDYTDSGLIYHEIIYAHSPIGKMELQDGWVFDTDKTLIFDSPVVLGFWSE